MPGVPNRKRGVRIILLYLESADPRTAHPASAPHPQPFVDSVTQFSSQRGKEVR